MTSDSKEKIKGSELYHITIELPNQNNLKKTFDCRYSNIEITCIDIENNTDNKMDFQLSEPIKALVLEKGILRLYREFNETKDEESFNCKKNIEIREKYVDQENILSILAIPAYFITTDLLRFLGNDNLNDISHIRILKTVKLNRSLALIKFRSASKASNFSNNFNGKPFNSMEPELCKVVYIKYIIMDACTSNYLQMQNISSLMSAFLLQDPFTNLLDVHDEKTKENKEDEQVKDKKLIELPTCPVCLERMDSSISGLLTIPCLHTFHCSCLSKWKDDSCPICRYTNNQKQRKFEKNSKLNQTFFLNDQNRLLIQTQPINNGVLADKKNTDYQVSDEKDCCKNCNIDYDLWICMICGNVGCSRYTINQHSLKHFIETGHCFAMESSTSRVWNYLDDTYVHRLVTNESDGKLVELPEKDKNINNDQNTNNEKAEKLGLEYSQLIITQLDSQKEYYEALLENHLYFNSLCGNCLNNTSSLNKKELDLKKFSQEASDLNDKSISTLESELKNLKNKIEQQSLLKNLMSKKITCLNKQNDFLNKSLTKITKENEELKSQVFDLMFFLDNQNKFKNQPNDVKEGKIIIKSNSLKSNKKN